MSITFQREELFAEVWTTPLTTLATKYGLSDNGVRKVCKAMDIPLPKAGHWAKAAAGKAPPPPLLPASAARTTFHSTPVQKSETPTQSVDEDKAWLDARLIEEKKARNKIVVAAKPAKWHPAVLPLKIWLEGCVTKYRNALAEKARREKSPKRPPEPAFHEWEIASNDPVLGRTYRSVAMRVPDMVAGSANLLYGLVFKLTGVHDMGVRFAEGAPLSIPDTIVRNTYIGNREAIEVAMIGTQLLGVRLATILLVAPTVVLLYVVAAVDGLTQRAIRRACGGRESASIYHRGKHLQVVLIAVTGGLCLLLPVSIDPRLLWWPAAVAAAVLTRTQWAFYKKHL